MSAAESSEVNRLLTPEDLADRWTIKRSTVYSMTRAGQLPTVRIGPRLYRYRLEAIEAYELAGGQNEQEQR